MVQDLLDFRSVYEVYQPRILRYLTRLVSEAEAEDLTQEVFVKAHQALEAFRGEANISTWLYSIAINVAIDRLRSPSFRRTSAECPIDDGLEETRIEIADLDFGTGEKTSSLEQQVFRDQMQACIRVHLSRLQSTIVSFSFSVRSRD